MKFAIISVAALAALAWYLTRCDWPKDAPVRRCKKDNNNV